MRVRAGGILALLVCSASAVVAVAAPTVKINEVRVGYGDRFRPGHLTPLFVRLSSGLPTPFKGELQVLQKDDDGERLRWRAEAHLAAGAKDQIKSVMVCPQGSGVGLRGVRLSLVDASGRVVATGDLGRLPRLPEAVPPGCRVIGVMGANLHGFSALGESGYRTGNTALPREPMMVVPVPEGGRFFPVVWHGLDMIDVIYWDNPDLSELSNEQEIALVQWVRRGGRLVVGLGSRAGSYRSGHDTLSDMLPVAVEHVGERVADLRPLGKALVNRPWEAAFAVSIPMVRTRAKLGALVRAADAQLGCPLLAVRPYRSGSVTAMSVCLADWRRAESKPTLSPDMLAGLLDIPTSPRDGYRNNALLSDGMTSDLDSAGVGGMLVSVVVLLVLFYAVLAGPGTWLFLRYRNQRHLSWWAFAFVAGVATVAGVLLSRFPMRSASVANALVLDLYDLPERGRPSHFGVVRGYFGLYVASHRDVTLALRQDANGELLPMIDPHLSLTEGFPDPRRYDLDAMQPRGVEAPIRRTIKRFALNWEGDVKAGVTADLRMAPSASPRLEGPFRPVGTVRSTLPVPLRRPVLIYVQPDKDQKVYVMSFPTLPPNKDVPCPKALDASMLRTLADFQKGLHRSLGLQSYPIGPGAGGRRDFLSRIQLMTTLAGRAGYEPDGYGPRVGRSLMGRMDRSELLRPGWALLIGAAEGYLPADVDFGGLDPDVTGTTVVRVLLHVAGPPGT